jgi:hypothetical protein
MIPFLLWTYAALSALVCAGIVLFGLYVRAQWGGEGPLWTTSSGLRARNRSRSSSPRGHRSADPARLRARVARVAVREAPGGRAARGGRAG